MSALLLFHLSIPRMARSVTLLRSFCTLCQSSLTSSTIPHARTAASRRQQSTASSSPSTSGNTSDSDSLHSTNSSISDRTSTSSSSKTRIVASILLSRPPRRLPALSGFEKEYYRYARRINKATAGKFDSEWYFRKGSMAEQAYKEQVEASELGRELEDSDKPVRGDEQAEANLHNLDRQQDRTLYLLAKKGRNEYAWQFPQGGVEEQETLSQAALRELLEEFGSQLDVWQTGKVPAAWYGYSHQQPNLQGYSDTKVFFMPARFMRGTPSPNEQEGLLDYAWCTREEVRDRVAQGYYQSIESVLSH